MSKTLKDYFEDFLGHPLYLFIFTWAALIIVAVFPQGPLQFVFISALGTFWVCTAVVHARTKMLWSLYETLPGRIRYHRLIKEIKIMNEKGDAEIGLFVEGENLSNSSLGGLFHEIKEYDSVDFPPSKIEGTLDGEKTEVSITSNSKTRKGETTPSKYESKFSFKFPDPVPPRSTLPIHGFSVQIPKCFKKAFESPPDTTVHSVDVMTDDLIIKVDLAPQIALINWDFSVEDFHRNVDPEELERVRKKYSPHLNGKMLMWEVKKPKLTNRYLLKLTLEKR